MATELSEEIKDYNIYGKANIFYNNIERRVINNKEEDIWELVNDRYLEVLEKYWDKKWELIFSDFREILKLKCSNLDNVALKISKSMETFDNKTKYIDITQMPVKWKKYWYHWYDPICNKDSEKYKPKKYSQI